MKTYYGVDSVTPAQQVAPLLQATWGTLPSFWARYIGGKYAIDRAELDWLTAHGIRVLFVYNNLSDVTVAGGFDVGVVCANAALNALAGLNVDPAHAFTVVDIESQWNPTTAFLLGWCQTMAFHTAPGGIYANTEWAAFDTPYAGIVGQVERRYRLAWTPEPQAGYVAPPGPAWGAIEPPADTSVSVVWQYYLDAPELNRLVDLNLATEEAYGLMYGAPVAPPGPTYPYTTNASKRADLKAADPATSKPSHSSPTAIDDRHRPITVELGADLIVTGPTIVTDDRWVPCNLPLPSNAHGWFLEANLKQDS